MKDLESPNQPGRYVNNFGFAKVGDDHELYFEDWGNQGAATPVIYLHGGPGTGFNDGHKSIFNPLVQRVIFFDQRDSGRSRSKDSLNKNSTFELVDDITKLASHLNIDKFYLAGGSWGSSLALLYAINNPDKVKAMLVWSIFLARQQDALYPFSGAHADTDPEAWGRFISLVPQDIQNTPAKIVDFYRQKILSGKQEATKYADEWILWEASILRLQRDEQKLENSVIGTESNLQMAKIMLSFAGNGYFLEDNYIIKNIKQASHIPCYAVHGRHDRLTPPISALDLAHSYGKNLTLQWVNSAHSTSEPETFSALKAASNLMFI